MSYPWKADMGADVAARLPSANKRHPSVVLSNPPAAIQHNAIGYDGSLWNAVSEHVTMVAKTGAAWFTLFVGTPQAREQSY
jgi:hypothetical protein